MAWLLFAVSFTLFMGMQALPQAPYCNGIEPLSLSEEKEYVFAMVGHIKDLAEKLGTDFNYLNLLEKISSDIFTEANYKIDWSKITGSSKDIELCRSLVSEDYKKSLVASIAAKKLQYKALSEKLANATYEFWKIERPQHVSKGLLSKVDLVKTHYTNICKSTGTALDDFKQLKNAIRSTFTSVVQPAYDCIMKV